jgi:hypothetical protein
VSLLLGFYPVDRQRVFLRARHERLVARAQMAYMAQDTSSGLDR